jgi:lipid A ethanolaminephosphotransferase
MLSHGDGGWHIATAYEPLPSYLQRHGIDVIWRTNNFGEPPIKVRTYQRAEDIPGACSGSSCRYDEALLHGLEQLIGSSTSRRLFIVLHQHGSHGPVYTTGYPPRFEVFKPVCASVELNRCTPAELVNAYDNTILYTDDLLHRTIELLRRIPSPSVMLYVSDHGESLGEKGLYLHGAPYSIAPDVQKGIPFLVWMSDEFKERAGVTNATLARRNTASQANVFHSVMGAFGMRSDVYDPALDLFATGPQ